MAYSGRLWVTSALVGFINHICVLQLLRFDCLWKFFGEDPSRAAVFSKKSFFWNYKKKTLILQARIHGAWHNIRNFQRNPVRSWSWESQMQCQRPIQGLHSLHLECKTMSLTLHLGLFVIHVLSPSWLFVLEVLWLVQFAFYDCKWDRGLLHAHSCVDIRVFLRFVYQCTFRCAYMLRCLYICFVGVVDGMVVSLRIFLRWMDECCFSCCLLVFDLLFGILWFVS